MPIESEPAMRPKEAPACRPSRRKNFARDSRCSVRRSYITNDTTSASHLSPYAREPGLLVARKAGRSVVVLQLDEAGTGHISPPAFEIVKSAVALALPSFFVVAARIGAEQDSARLQRRMQLFEHARQLGARHVKERRVGEDAVEFLPRQIEPQKILFPHLAAAVGARHFREPV